MTELSTRKPTVALLGTGTMGAGMARNIAAAGLPLRVWNRDGAQDRPLAEAGAVVTSTVAEAVSGADVVLTMLFDAACVAEVIGRAGDALAPGTIWVQSSTVGVEGMDQVAKLAAERDLILVDAPVLGTKKLAEKGTLVVLAAGPEQVRSQLEPLFTAIGSRTMWVGPNGANGAATRLKLVADGWEYVVLDGVAQSRRMTKAFGLEPALFLEAIKGRAVVTGGRAR